MSTKKRMVCRRMIIPTINKKKITHIKIIAILVVLLIILGLICFVLNNLFNTDLNEKNYCSSESKIIQMCTLQYEPVCGKINNFYCVLGFCKKTFTNSCFACKDKNVNYWANGEC